MSFKFALIIALYVLAEISAQDDCTQGKSYWCLNLNNAKSCNAVEECISIWQNEPEIESDDKICSACKEIMAKVEIYGEREEEEKLKDEFENKCKSIELEDERRKCINTADKLAPEVAMSTISNLSPQKICSLIGSCPRSADAGKQHSNGVSPCGPNIYGSPQYGGNPYGHYQQG